MNRRKFIGKSTLLSMFGEMHPFKNIFDPEAEFNGQRIPLWDESSSLNLGQNPAYKPAIELYYPAFRLKKDKLAVVLICPGGGYRGQARHEGEPFARMLALAGIIGVVLTYRVFPDRYPAAFTDAARAIRFLRKNAVKFNVDPERVGIMGFSAGGHLAATLATQPDHYLDPEDDLANEITARPNRVILGYPVISFENFAHQGSINAYLGENPEASKIKMLSLQHQVNSKTPPAFLFHTANDQVVPVENSMLFAQACIDYKVPVELHIFPKGEHGVGTGLGYPGISIWTENLMNWLKDWTIT